MWVTQLGSLDVAADNASTGADMLTTAEENYALLTNHLQRIRDLTEQAANGTYGSQSLKSIHAEIVARLQEINRIAANVEFNGIQLMDGTGVNANGLNLQVGLYANENSRINLSQSLFSSANLTGLFTGLASKTSAGGVDLSTLMGAAKSGATVDDLKDNANGSIEALAAVCSGLKYVDGKMVLQQTENYEPMQMLEFLDSAINDISNRVTKIGAAQNRITSALASLDVQSQNITSSLSTLRDTDVARESSNYLQAQILQQASATLLSTANQLPSVALNLL
jgi:flagellin